jgi:hypothetical protein
MRGLMSNSYPADDVTKIVTGCSDVVFEMETPTT